MTNIELEFECETSSKSNFDSPAMNPESSTGGTGAKKSHMNIINIREE